MVCQTDHEQRDVPGMERPRARTSRDLLLAVFCWSLCTAASGAQDNGQDPDAEEEENNAAEQSPLEVPDLEFIEFLGQFESDAGEWIAPGNLMMDEFDNFLEVIGNQQDTDN